ncbi:MAG: hypothetical protein LBI26_02690 [Holosporales bacterium]|jgi:N-glycosylase/DNA lyase|nr:hypothetical protein [Holosporales bacterium]
MVSVKIPDFCIEQIANSGQCFRVNKIGETLWQVVALGKVLQIEQTKDTCIFYCSLDEYEKIWIDYFDIERDYAEIKNSILKLNDQYLLRAVQYGSGLRMLRQDVWEVMVSFIISQRNSIPRIKNTIERLCALYGAIFPSADILAKYTTEDFEEIGLGYRAKYLVDIAKAVFSGKFDIKHLKMLDYKESIEYLKQVNGIGDKVANCIALFGLHKIEAFPRDVWINRIIEKQYNGEFDVNRFSKYAGIVQQYMFFYERSLRR